MMEHPWYMGIDPGKGGAMAFYREYPARELVIHDFPLTKRSSQHRYRKDIPKTEIAITETANIIKEFMLFQGEILVVLLETPNSLPNDGHVGAFNFGKACGVMEGILGTLNLPVVPTVPAAWKGELKLSPIKSKSLDKARQLFSDINGVSEYFLRAKDDGRAEAALLAWLACTKFGGKK